MTALEWAALSQADKYAKDYARPRWSHPHAAIPPRPVFQVNDVGGLDVMMPTTISTDEFKELFTWLDATFFHD